MSEKHLTELPWKTLVAKHKVKDNGLQRALLAYGKLDAIKDRGQLLEALAEIAEGAVKLKKANGDNKEIAGYLDEIIKEVPRTRGSLPAMPTLEQQEDAQESADVRVWLANTLKKVKATENGPPVAFVACVAKPFYGLLLAKNASEQIGAAHKKALTDFTQGVRFILGSCLFENSAHTFVVDPVPAGLAKNLKKAIKEITGQACKV